MSEFIDYLHELLAPLGRVATRRMFGGYGVYHQGVMFALVADEVLYLKVDDQSLALFEQAGCEPFVFYRDGRPVVMSYREAPVEMFEDPDQARYWAQLAWQAAQRQNSKKPAARAGQEGA
jgi:DNA transformation protein